jgi:hypothetical protein
VNDDDEPPALLDGLVPDREPGPFDTIETWEQWLAEVHTWPRVTPLPPIIVITY